MGAMQALRTAWSDRRLDDAWAEYRRLVAMGEADAETHLVGARAARAKNDLFGARWAIEAAAGANPTGAILGQVRFTYGNILRELGEVLPAIEQLTACIDGFDDYPELAPLMLGPTYYNLGLALRQARRYTDAIEAYGTAREHFRRENMDSMLCMTLHNLAWVACLEGRLDEAGEALDESRSLAGTDTLRWHQRLGEAFLESLGGESDRRHALELCQVIVSEPGEVPTHVRSHACWVAGRVALALHQPDAAEQLAVQALNHATAARGENRCLTDAAELLKSVREIRLIAQPPGS